MAKVIFQLDRAEALVIRAALCGHCEKLEPPIRRARKERDSERLSVLTGEQKSARQIICGIDHILADQSPQVTR